MRSALRR
ncbi:Protein of unknown function [Thermobacillus xylanilyticus]|nr:Protein of unknown function [Thermobacillus xylanilyticus]